jgi:hypothetical protein
MQYLKRAYWERGGQPWSQAQEKYRVAFAANAAALPVNAQRFLEFERQHQLHDAGLKGFYRLGAERIALELGSYWLDFFGVEEAAFHGEEHFGVWLVYELHYVSASLIRLCVLFEYSDLDVTARCIRVYSKAERRYLVPDESPVAAATPPSPVRMKKRT